MPRDMSRQSGLVNQEMLRQTVTYVIGLGAVGHTLSKLLANLGVGALVLNDFDVVELVNLATQGYNIGHVGYPKTLATVQEVLHSVANEEGDTAVLNTVWEEMDYDDNATNKRLHVQRLGAELTDAIDLDMGLAIENIRVDAQVFSWFAYLSTGVVFSCVDTMDARREAFGAAATVQHNRWFVDCRMAGLTLRVLTVDLHDPASRESYLATLVANADAHPGACTARGTLYSASIIAGIAVSQAVLALHASLPDHARDVIFNLGAMEMISNGNPDPVGAGARA